MACYFLVLPILTSAMLCDGGFITKDDLNLRCVLEMHEASTAFHCWDEVYFSCMESFCCCCDGEAVCQDGPLSGVASCSTAHSVTVLWCKRSASRAVRAHLAILQCALLHCKICARLHYGAAAVHVRN